MDQLRLTGAAQTEQLGIRIMTMKSHKGYTNVYATLSPEGTSFERRDPIPEEEGALQRQADNQVA